MWMRNALTYSNCRVRQEILMCFHVNKAKQGVMIVNCVIGENKVITGVTVKECEMLKVDKQLFVFSR